MTTYRDTIRLLRKGDKTADAFTSAINAYDPAATRRTPTATLEHFITAKIPTAHENTITEALRMGQMFIHVFSEPNTANNVINRIRNEIIKRFGRDSVFHKKAMTLMFVHRADMVKKSKDYAAKIEAKNAEPDKVNASTILKIVEDVRGDIPTIALQIQLATGGRIGEVLATSYFKAVDTMVIQTGVSKVRGGAALKIVKPLLCYSAGVFNKLFNIMRALIDIDKRRTDETPADISNRLNASILNRLKEITGGEITKSHTLRKLYALAAWKTRPDAFKKYSQQAFYAHVLGHANLNTAKSYSTVEIIDDSKKDDHIDR